MTTPPWCREKVMVYYYYYYYKLKRLTLCKHDYITVISMFVQLFLQSCERPREDVDDSYPEGADLASPSCSILHHRHPSQAVRSTGVYTVYPVQHYTFHSPYTLSSVMCHGIHNTCRVEKY